MGSRFSSGFSQVTEPDPAATLTRTLEPPVDGSDQRHEAGSTLSHTSDPKSTGPSSPFQVVRLANTALDECRRRVQNETCGHRGRKNDPLWRVRRRLSMAAERLTLDQHDRLVGLLRAGDPKQEVWFAWNAKEVVRQTYAHSDPELADAWVAEIVRDFADESMPVEVRRLGRTTAKWAHQVTAWHRSHVSNGPTEGRQQPRETDQARRVRPRQLSTSPSALPALHRQTRLAPVDHDPTLKRGEPPYPDGFVTSSLTLDGLAAQLDLDPVGFIEV